MNKKGFTLVELLAVIAILAILVIIALPNVLKMFNNAKKNAFETEIKEIAKTIELQWMQDSMFTTTAHVYNKCKTGCTSNLDMNVRDELEYYAKLNTKGDIIYFYATDGSYQYEYSGEKLNYRNINNVATIADIDPEEVITITSSGVQKNGSAVNGATPSAIIFTSQTTQNQVTANDVLEISGLGSFKVISISDNKAVLLPKYILNVGPNKSSSFAEFAQDASITGTVGENKFSEEDYWSGNIGSGKTYPGNAGSSPYAYVFDSHSLLFDYASRYETLVRNKGLDGAHVRLMTYEEANSLMSSDKNYLCQSTFWLGSARWGSIYETEVVSTCSIKAVAYSTADGRGFRPVIEVATSELLK